MSTRIKRLMRTLVLAVTVAAAGTPAAHAMYTENGPAHPLGHAATASVSRSDAAQRPATSPVTGTGRSDAAQIDPAEHPLLHGRVAAPAVTAPSPAPAPSDDFDWALAGSIALVACCFAGFAVIVRPRRVSV